MHTCALIAAYDEAATIADVVRGIHPLVQHVVVVDDGSNDGTGAIASAAGAEVLTHPVNRGKGAAIRTGLDAILPRDFTHVLFLDGDMQHAPEDAAGLMAAAQRGEGDVIVGERPFNRETM